MKKLVSERNEDRVAALRLKYGPVGYAAYKLLQDKMLELGGELTLTQVELSAGEFGIDNLAEITRYCIEIGLLHQTTTQNVYHEAIVAACKEAGTYINELSQKRKEAARKSHEARKRNKERKAEEEVSKAPVIRITMRDPKELEGLKPWERKDTIIEQAGDEVTVGNGFIYPENSKEVANELQNTSKGDANHLQNTSKIPANEGAEVANGCKKLANLQTTICTILSKTILERTDVRTLKEIAKHRIATLPHRNTPFTNLSENDFLEQVDHFRGWLPDRILDDFYGKWGAKDAYGVMRFQTGSYWQMETKLGKFIEQQPAIDLAKQKANPYTAGFSANNFTNSQKTITNGETYLSDRKRREEEERQRYGTR